ncbi:hypothetical protein [Methylovorus mays]|uniref:hypothetical protein n=1 Tax=Methylovorus mays TaxID=184077 RepID=UPI001E3263BB|nr:hypothetical protein [Methylovorus mays]MCB5206495.1 hypothetical protein [Methylovorus mays]
MLKVIDTNLLNNDSKAYPLFSEYFEDINNFGCISAISFSEIFNCTLHDPIITNGYKRVWDKLSVIKDFSDRIYISNSGIDLSRNIFARLDKENLINKKANLPLFIKELENAAENGTRSQRFEDFFKSAYIDTKNLFEYLDNQCKTVESDIRKFDSYFSDKELREFCQDKISNKTIYKICSICRQESRAFLPTIDFIKMVMPDFDCNSTFIFQSRLSKFSAYTLFKRGKIPTKIKKLRAWEIDTQNSALALCTDGLISHDINFNKVFARAKEWLKLSDISATFPTV